MFTETSTVMTTVSTSSTSRKYRLLLMPCFSAYGYSLTDAELYRQFIKYY